MNMDFQTACSALRTVTARDEVVMLLQQITAFLLKGGVFMESNVVLSNWRVISIEPVFSKMLMCMRTNANSIISGNSMSTALVPWPRRTTRWIIACASAFAFPIAPIIITVP